MLYVTRRETFSSSHRLYNPDFSEEENREIFGKCNNINGHGHNYVLEVTVAGKINNRTGYIIDLNILKNIIKENVTDLVDHKNLNLDVPFLKGIIPTTENLTIGIWKQLENKITAGSLYSVKVFETENNYFEYKGEQL